MNPAWLQWPQTQTLIAAFPAGSLRFVGGAVRDALLGREVLDVDAATCLLPDETMALLEAGGIRAIPTGIAHGTVTAVIDGRSFEITTLRRDIATDGRHAEVAFTDDWQEDAARRDFTMNALYLSPDGTLSDYFGGVEDAKAGHVRFIGDANLRITEDYLRILRFFRFHAHYGQGAPDEAALAACSAHASGIAALSGERVRHELLLLLKAPAAADVLQLMQAHRILPRVLGFTVLDCSVFEHLALPAHPAVQLAAFVETAAADKEEAFARLVTRLRLPNALERHIRALRQALRQLRPDLNGAAQKRLLRKTGREDFTGAVLLSAALGGNAALCRTMLQLADSWTPPPFPLGGDDLIALGIPSGKALGDLLARLEEQWEASDYTLSKDQLLVTARQSR